MSEPHTDIRPLPLNNRKVFLGIFDAYYDTLCSFVHRFLDDPSSCEDCVQEAFIALWNHRDEIATATHVKSFLYQVCRNNALNVLKHERIKMAHAARVQEELSSPVYFIGQVIEEEAEQLLAQTEQQLPPRCRDVFVLAVEGMSNAGIAAQLGVSENTVKTQKKIAYKRLKENISRLNRLFVLLLSI